MEWLLECKMEWWKRLMRLKVVTLLAGGLSLHDISVP